MTREMVLDAYNGSTSPNKRQKVGHNGGANLRMCHHCGRSFKRTEHLERHVRTHTKEKPFLCHCGASFARRDLLTRHQRIAEHESDAPSPGSLPGPGPLTQSRQNSISGEQVDLAAAVSLSGHNVDPWFCARAQQAMQVPVPLTVDEQTQRPPNIDAGQFVPNFLSPQMLDSGVDFDTHFREFTSFLDGVGLSAEWSPFFGDRDRHQDPVDSELRHEENETVSPQQGAPTRAGTPFSSWLPSAPTGNRINNYVSDTDNPRAVDPETRPFKVTEDQRSKIKAFIKDLSHLLDPTFCIPSRHALTRYVTSFFGGFHSHMPFIHVPTWQITEHSPELIFGIAAIGAQYCFERKASERLFFAGKALVLERLRRNAELFDISAIPRMHTVNSAKRSDRDSNAPDKESQVETIRALVTLMGFATWEPKAAMVQESFFLQGILTQALRNAGLEDVDALVSTTPSNHPHDSNALWHDWRTWAKQESCRRSKLICFSFLHTHSIAYNVYPTLRSNEVGLRLPCSTKEWKAPNAASWRAAAREVQEPQLFFREALSLLLKNKSESAPLFPIPTPLGNYVLLHGLLQRIHIVRDLSLPITSSSAFLPSEEVEKLERGLRSWTSCWQQAPESTLDPNNENGPIPFTSSSLLALAYVRIYLHLGPFRQLETRDPQLIAEAIASSPDIERSDGVIAALLYAAHMIGIPVRLGVDRVARSQAFFWSVRHSLSGLDCAVLLSKWLSKLAETVSESPLSDSEDRILHWVRCIVEEAYTVVDFEQSHDQEIANLLDFTDPENLSLAVLKIWAHFFKSNTQWLFINIIGVGLERYREMLLQKI